MNFLAGQGPMVSQIEQFQRSGNWPTSFLLIGPAGSGKQTAAKVIARAVNCDKGKVNTGCDCLPCKKTDSGNHPDVRWTGLDEEVFSIKIDDIHQLILWASYRPLEGKKKVFIVNLAERMTEEAANALLKTLEEPPDHTVIILLTENETAIKETLISRCFRFKMKPLAEAELVSVLKEQFGWNASDADGAAGFAEGIVGKALEAKENNLPETARFFLEEFLPNPAQALEKWVGKKKPDLLAQLRYLAYFLRDLTVYKETGDLKFLYYRESAPALKTAAARFATPVLVAMLETVRETDQSIQENANPKIALFRAAKRFQEIYEQNLLPHNAALLR